MAAHAAPAMSEARKRRLTIDAGADGRLAVLVPPLGSVADACAAAETRLAKGSGPSKRRRIRTLALPDGCELGAEDCIADAVGDGEELRPVYIEDDDGGEDTTTVLPDSSCQCQAHGEKCNW